MKKLAFLLFLWTAGFSAAAVPYSLIDNAGDAGDYPGADYLVIFDSTKVDVKPSGLSYKHMHTLHKVLTPEGAKNLNHLDYRYDPLSAYVEIRKVVIYRNDGTKEVLGDDAVYDYPAPARMIYWGARRKMIRLGRLEPGDAVEVFMFRKGFTYALLKDGPPADDKYVPPMRGHFYDIVEFWNNRPVKKKVYQVDVPQEKFFDYTFYNGELQTQKANVGDKIRYTFTKTELRPVTKAPHAVATSNIAPKLLMTTTRKWEQKAVWFYNVNEDYGSFKSTLPINKKVNEILEGASNEMDSISRLTHWVADNIRYSGLSMGEGEGYTLHKGSMTFRDRCGVCKDKAGMLITMLRAAGFESYAAMTMAGSRIEDIPADQFNHSITVVKLSNGTYKLLDPTWVPFTRELWSSREQQQNYLMGLPEGADLMKTPVSSPDKHYFRMDLQTTIQENGNLKGTLSLEAEGQSDAAIRGSFTRSFKQEWRRLMEQKLQALATDIRLDSLDFGNPYDYQNGPINVYAAFTIPDYAIVTDEEIVFKPLSARDLFPNANYHLRFNPDREKREYGFRDRCSRLTELTETIVLPDFSKIIAAPEQAEVKNDIAAFAGNYTSNGNKLKLSQRLKFSKRVYKADSWEKYRNVLQARRDFVENAVIIAR